MLPAHHGNNAELALNEGKSARSGAQFMCDFWEKAGIEITTTFDFG